MPAVAQAAPPRREGTTLTGSYAVRLRPPALSREPPDTAALALDDMAPLPASAPAASAEPTRTLVLTLHELGAAGPLSLRGGSALQGVEFGVRADEVVVAATLTLSGAMSPALIPAFSNDTVTLNGHYVGTIPTNPDQPGFENLRFALNPAFFAGSNRLNIRFTGRYSAECDDPLSGLLWSSISDSSTLTLTLTRLPPQRDLARLPLPFFDAHDNTALVLPFVLPESASDELLTASAIAASWLGGLAAEHGAHFPVLSTAPATGNAVLILADQHGPAGILLPQMNGPTLAVIPNPNDPAASLLLVGGRTGAEALTAASALALGSRLLAGAIATVAPPDAPYRQPYDAPAWLPTTRPIQLGELVDPASLEGPGTIHVPLRTAPDLYSWRKRPFPLQVKVATSPAQVAGRLDVGINNLLLTSLELPNSNAAPQSWRSWLSDAGAGHPSARVDVPAYALAGQNDLQFAFHARPMRRSDCTAVADDVHEAIDPDSTIDLRAAYHFTTLPNLASFTASGFPFTRLADLADTAAVLPAKPSADEVAAFLDLMGRLGRLTGYPVTRMAVVRPDAVSRVSARDLLLLGTTGDLGAAAALLDHSPYRIVGTRLQVSLPTGWASMTRWFGNPNAPAQESAVTALSAVAGPDSAALVGAASPFGAGRSVVALLGGSPAAAGALVSALGDTDQARAIGGDLALLTGGRISSYQVGATYAAGRLPFWLSPVWLLVATPLRVTLGLLLGCLLLGVGAFGAVRQRATGSSPRP